MKPFEYTAVDAQGRPISGSIEAADWPQAEQRLEAEGLKHCRAVANGLAVPAIGTHAATLNAAQTVELFGYIAQLAKTGLPVESGLRAMAGDLDRGPLAESLGTIAQGLETGRSMDSVLQSFGPSFPTHLRQAVLLAARGGHLTTTLDALIAQQQLSDEMRRQFQQTLFYPLVILSMLIVWLLFFTLWIVPAIEVQSITEGFGTISRPFVSHVDDYARLVPRLILGGLAGTFLVVAATRVLGGRGALSRLIAQLPLIGPLWWYRGLTEFSGLLAVFLEQQVSLAEALRQVAATAADPAVRDACYALAAEVSTGHSLTFGLARRGLFPPTLVQLVQRGEAHAALTESLRTANELFYARFQLQREVVRTFVPPIMFFLAATSVLFAVSMYFTLFKLLRELGL